LAKAGCYAEGVRNLHIHLFSALASHSTGSYKTMSCTKLITETFYKILWNQSQILIRLARTVDPKVVTALETEYTQLLENFYQAMNDVFGIDKITWEKRLR